MLSRLLSLFFLLFILRVSVTQPQELSPEEIYRSVQASVLIVKTFDDNSVKVSSGTAVVVSRDGLVYTVFHMLGSGSFLKLFQNDKEIEDVKIIGLDPDKDILILKIPPVDFTPITVGNSDSVNIGEVVYTIGNPKRYYKTFAEGMLSNLTIMYGLKQIQFSASISPGSSGGALLNKKGELIGITASCDDNGQNLNFAIPVNEYLNTETIDFNDSVQLKLITSIAKFYNKASESPTHSIVEIYNLFMNSGISYNSLYRSVGQICYDGSFSDTAIKVYTNAINKFPNDKYFYVKRAVCYMKNCQFDSAEADFQKAIEIDSVYDEIYFNRSFFYYYNVNKYPEAIKDFTKLLELHPDYYFLYRYRASAYLNTGDTLNAIKDLELAVRDKLADGSDYYELGIIYKDLKMYKDAIYNFTLAIEKETKNKDYYFDRAIVYSLTHKHELAVLDYLKYVELDSRNPKAYNNLAWGYYNIHELELAEKYFNKALSLNSNYVDSYIGLAVTYYNKNSIVKCKRNMYEAIKRAPALERGMKGLDEIKHQGLFWSNSEMRDIKKVFILMGIEEKQDINKRPKRKYLGRELEK